VADGFEESLEHKSKEKQGNLVCKAGTMLCFVVAILVGFVLVADFIWNPSRPDLIPGWTPELNTLAILLIGFVAGWIVRDATKK
jgi:uncharacterized protein (DUF983 family)